MANNSITVGVRGGESLPREDKLALDKVAFPGESGFLVKWKAPA